MKPEIKEIKPGIIALDIKIIIAIGICCLTSTLLNVIGLKLTFGEIHLEIIQKMTACIACLLCTQDNAMVSAKAGKMRVLVTLIGGVVALLVVGLDILISNQWLSIIEMMLGVLLTLFICKCVKIPYMNSRIGAITFVLVACTLSGNSRFIYAIMRLISTVYGALVVWIVTILFDKFALGKPA